MEVKSETFGSCIGKPTPLSNLEIANGATSLLMLDFTKPGCTLNIPRSKKEHLTINFTYSFNDDPATAYSARGTLFAKAMP